MGRQHFGSQILAVLSILGTCVAMTLLLLVVYQLLWTHPTGERLYLRIAYLPVFAGAIVVGISRYRMFTRAAALPRV